MRNCQPDGQNCQYQVVYSELQDAIRDSPAQAGLWEREAAQKAEQLSKSSRTANLKEFFAQITKVEQKRIEVFDTFRQSAEIWMTEDVFNTIVSKRNALMLRVQPLQNEAAALELKLAEMQPRKR